MLRFPQDRGGFRYAASGWASAVVLASKAMGDIMAAELTAHCVLELETPLGYDSLGVVWTSPEACRYQL